MNPAAKPLRIGLMIPSNNTTMEGELLQWLPEGSSCRTLRVHSGPVMLTREGIPDYVRKSLDLARIFNEDPPDIVVYGCTAAGFLSGQAKDAEIAAALADLTGKPAVTTSSSMVGCLRESGAKQIAVVTPYIDALNQQLRAVLESSGITVRRLETFNASTTEELGRITGDMVAALARETMQADCDAMFIACTQLPTRAIIGPLARGFGRPVLSSIQATAQRVLHAAH